jgi:hypothetical protein
VNKRTGDSFIKILFDYQRFQGEPGLTRLIGETDKRLKQTDMEPIALPDDSVSALAAAQGGTNFVLCSFCGAVLRGEEALQAHVANAHRSTRL